MTTANGSFTETIADAYSDQQKLAAFRSLAALAILGWIVVKLTK